MPDRPASDDGKYPAREPERNAAMQPWAHLYEPGMTYLLTAVIQDRKPLCADARSAQIACDDIAFYTDKFQASSPAYVIMPDHIHWIICPSPHDFERFAREEQDKGGRYARAPDEYYLTKIVEDYKRHVSYKIHRVHNTRGMRVWQKGFRDDGLRTPRAIRSAVRYVIMNPVQAGLVDAPEQYPYLVLDNDWLV
jgi:putative transposase